MTRDRQWHYVAPNETTRVPRRLVFLDSESSEESAPGMRTQRWAVGVACYVTTRPDRPSRERWECYDDPVILWKSVDQWCGESGRTVLFTHNLGYDARITDALRVLPELGWRLIAHNMAAKGMWLTWRRGRATLQMCDSASVFPCTLLKLGELIRLPKLHLPDPNAHGIGLYSRCWRDVEILRTAMLQYLQWIERADLGNWQLTGAGQAWAVFRHKFLTHHLLVHDDGEALRAERRAMWTGRCEAYWHGEINYQVVHEWDLELAYGTIARDTNVPIRLLGPMPADLDWRALLSSSTTAVLAEVRIRTDSPVVPASHEGRIVWPVGEFTTTLWTPEIRAAIDAGADVELIRGWVYRTAPALRAWATWCIDQVNDAAMGAGDWRYPVCKHWLRALVGRLAMTYTDWEPFATAPFFDVRSHPMYDDATGETTMVVQVGRELWQSAGEAEWSQSMPMITGYVQSVARVRYWTIYREAPPNSVLYGDTDSVLVTDMHLSAMADVARAHPDWGLRLKRSWQGFAVWGPRQIRTGASVRVSGVARGAQRVGAREFAGEVWESFPGAMARGHPGEVVIRDRTWHVRGIDRRRDGPDIGWTQPIRLGGGQHD